MKRVLAMALVMLAAVGLCLTVGLSMASAATVAAAANNSGGYIVLTPVDHAPNGHKCFGSFVALSFGDGNAAVMGCWKPDGDNVLVKWNDGPTITYQQTEFSITEVDIDFDAMNRSNYFN